MLQRVGRSLVGVIRCVLVYLGAVLGALGCALAHSYVVRCVLVRFGVFQCVLVRFSALRRAFVCFGVFRCVSVRVVVIRCVSVRFVFVVGSSRTLHSDDRSSDCWVVGSLGSLIRW